MNEKTPLLPGGGERSTRCRLGVVIMLTVVAAGSLLANIFFNVTGDFDADVMDEMRGQNDGPSWGWDSMKSSRDLNWESCYEGRFECARLDVPMDWQNPSEEERVILGVMKRPALTKDNPMPPLFINPGGPGGSGVKALQTIGEHIQTIAGDNYDIISWDPRGVGTTTPRMDCWGSFQKRSLWSTARTPLVDERPGLIYDAVAKAAAYSGACEQAMNETGIMEHMSTAYIARDLLEIVHKTGHEKIRFWGFSYGSVLAGTIASMWPAKVERMVSDGNVDYQDWYHGDHSKFVTDADKILDIFDEACHKAGSKKCELWASSPQAVQQRRADILESLKREPVQVPVGAAGWGPEMPELITYTSLQRLTRELAYKPLKHAETFARVYAALERGNGVPFLEAPRPTEGGLDTPISELLCSAKNVPSLEPQETRMELDAFPAIMCSDMEDMDNSPESLADYVDKITGLSKWTGTASLEFKLPCAGRTVKSKWRVVIEDETVETAHPILFVNNAWDNVTPLESAHNNSAHYPGSVVLQQNSLGHCTFAAPSTCTARNIRAYLQNGTLPDEGTVCPQDYELFEEPDNKVLAQDELSRAIRGLYEDADFHF